ncbi:hypothetical protein L6452_10206 [Arctium lappa]|uniref:Uncharacterized protein n=1 Tax=Arctium lappa TaxID=4217 RepID=A0ACB9DLX7_ARCLA|nr:hypothetical protein L6452_10206 [Arctium lappa]
MPSPYRFLSTVDKATPVAEPPEAVAVEADFVVILAALLCALICVVGLIAVARCSWFRRRSGASDTRRTPGQPSANRGIKRKIIEVLPKFTYDSNKEGKSCDNCGNLSSSDCAICLAEYVDGDEIRVLPQCGHGFHIGCIDTWLSSHSSCPSCRQILITTRCKKRGDLSTIAGKVPLEAKHSNSSSSSDYLP